jgi:copper/silver efflux system protein
MTGAEGKMFTPLAFTKTFVLIGSVIAALTVVPAAVHVLVAGRIDWRGRAGCCCSDWAWRRWG